MKKILVIIVLFLYSIILSQSYLMPYIPKVQSPNAYNLGMYGNYPVDQSTGVPRIDIPLYTIKSGKLVFPISLSYHASGIKVNQEASTVGLGWVLNAGGMIQRNLQDLPDEGISGFLTAGNAIPIYNDIDQPLISGAGIIGNNATIKSYYNNGVNPMEEGPNYMHKDRSPDFFNIITNLGLTGSFCLNNSGQFVSSELNPQKLDIDLNSYLMTIKDEHGNSYRFGKDFKNNHTTEMVYGTKMRIEKSNTGSSYDVQPGYYNSSWQLSAIISADKKDTIQIEYTKYRTKNYLILASESKTNVIAMDPNHQGGYGKQYLESEMDALVISKIKYKDGYVQFITNDDRKDIYPLNNQSPRVSGLTVYDLQNRVLQKVIFENNDYFERPKIADINYFFKDHYKKSLKLNSVKFYDQQNTFVNQYQFGYDYTIPLPARESTYGIDFWGYYNGKNSNTTLLPTVLFDNIINPRTLTNENRQADFNFMKSAVLNKIIYPTGGSTTYEYEPNYFLTKEQELSLGVFDGGASAYALKSSSGCTDESGLIASPHTIKEYNITQQAFGVIKFDVMLSGHYSLGQPLIATIDVDGEVKTITHGPTGSNNIKTESLTFLIHQGSHIKIDLDTKNATGPASGSPCNSPFISVSGRYKYFAPVPPESIRPTQAGGLRVKTILNMNSNNTILTQKSYKYGSKELSNIGFGKILTNPFEFENYYKRYTRYNVNATNYQTEMNVISSNPMVEISYSNGSPVFYDKVTEFIVDKNQENNKLGKKEYYYQEKGVDRIYTGNTFVPYPRYIYPEWKKTNLVKTITYKNDNNVYSPVNKEIYKYSKMVENRIRTVNIFERDTEALTFITPAAGGSGLTTIYGNPERFYYFNDYVSVGREVLFDKEVIEYVYGTQTDSLITKTNFQYTNPLHYQITRETTTYPDQSISQKILAYAHEKNNQKLITTNMIGFPLETTLVKKKNTSDVGKVITKNEVKYDNPNDVYPTSILSYDVQNGSSNVDATFDLYDANGKLQQYTTKDGISTVIIWGYDSTQPIAKLEGAKLSAISQSLITSIVSASNTDAAAGANNDETALFTAFKTFRESLPNYQITTYSYDPLIGVRSITPPSGIRENYIYDSAGRLEKVIDMDGKVLKEMKYNYKN